MGRVMSLHTLWTPFWRPDPHRAPSALPALHTRALSLWLKSYGPSRPMVAPRVILACALSPLCRPSPPWAPAQVPVLVPLRALPPHPWFPWRGQ